MSNARWRVTDQRRRALFEHPRFSERTCEFCLESRRRLLKGELRTQTPKTTQAVKSEAAVVYLRERLFFFPPFSPCVFVHFKPDRAFSQPASRLPLLIGRCRFVPLSSTSFSLGSSCDLLCLYSTILTLSFSPNPTNNEGDTCWSHLAPGLCESITEGGRRTPVYSCPVAHPPTRYPVFGDTAGTFLWESPKNGHHARPCGGFSCQLSALCRWLCVSGMTASWSMWFHNSWHFVCHSHLCTTC